MPVTIYEKQTGEALVRESVDAREILAASPDLYTDVKPGPVADGPVDVLVAALPETVDAASAKPAESMGRKKTDG